MSNTISSNSITIIIVLYKESYDLISNTLNKIENFKKIIIDNDGNDLLKKKILSRFSIDQYVLNKKNNGFSRGYNQGIKLSKTEFTLVLGPDCIIFEKDIKILVAKLLQYNNALIVSPTSYDELNNLSYAGGPLPEYAEKNQIPVPKDKRGEAPFSVDANLLHISAEGKILEDPWIEPEEFVYSRTKSPFDAPNKITEIELDFLNGDPISLNGKTLSPASMLHELNILGGNNGIGRIDLVENRFVGMKSRGVYETPGGTILFHMRKAIESITLDKGASHLKDELMPKYAELIYNGFWFSPERTMLQAAIDVSQKNVSGTVRAKLYKGNVIITGRKSPFSLYSESLVTFEEGSADYNHSDAEGFIKLNALRLRVKKMIEASN